MRARSSLSSRIGLRRLGAVAVLVLSLCAPAPLATGLETTSEQLSAEQIDATSIERLYWAYFLRRPDRSGLDYWIDRWRNGMPIESISGEFARSEEFRSRYGSVDDRRFVTLVYENVLDRTPDQGGYDYWLDRMAHGMTRGSLMIGFSESDEFKARVREMSGGESMVDGGVYAFLQPDRGDGTPTRWAPCEVRRVVANFTGAPAGAENHLRDALARLSAATDIDWVYTGRTTARAKTSAGLPNSALVDPATGTEAIVVSWASAWDDPGSIGVGLLGVQRVDGGPAEAAHGQVVLDPAWRAPSAEKLEALILHEFGHVAGLGHVDDPNELMYSRMSDTVQFGRGDLAGLRQLGAADVTC